MLSSPLKHGRQEPEWATLGTLGKDESIKEPKRRQQPRMWTPGHLPHLLVSAQSLSSKDLPPHPYANGRLRAPMKYPRTKVGLVNRSTGRMMWDQHKKEKSETPIHMGTTVWKQMRGGPPRLLKDWEPPSLHGRQGCSALFRGHFHRCRRQMRRSRHLSHCPEAHVQGFWGSGRRQKLLLLYSSPY